MDPQIDRRMLQSYLADHLTGAEGGRGRALDMADRYATTPFGDRLREVALQIDSEYGELKRLIRDLGLQQPILTRLVARVGETAGRLKPNGRLLSTTPTTPLLEVEVVRSAVNGKRGLWETLAANADAVGVDRAEMQRLAKQSVKQDKILSEVHEMIRSDAFNPHLVA